MKKTSRTTLMLMLVLLASTQLWAQKSEPDFDIKTGNLIAKTNVFLQASSGEIIAANDAKLYAIDPHSKSVIWESSDYLSLTPGDITTIENTPYIKIERQKKLSLSKNKNTYIIEAHTGKVVYDSREEGIKVQNTFPVPELNGLLVESIKDGFLSLSLIDINSAKTLWTAPIAKVKSGGFGVGALVRAVKSQLRNSNFKTLPLIDASGNLIVSYKKELMCIDGKNGSSLWKVTSEDNVDEMYMNNEGTAVYIGITKYIDKISTSTGKSTLPEHLKMRDELTGLIDMGNDSYVVMNKAGINILEAAGKFKWKKDLKLGQVDDAKFNENGILAVQIAKDNKETILYWVNNEGEKKWDNTLKGALIMSELTDKGVMYVTNERANVLSYEKGKDVWNKDIKIKGYPYFGVDTNNKIVYCFAKDIIHAFNFKDVTYKKLAEDIKLKDFNPEKELATLNVRKDGAGLFINTAQNVVYINTADGEVAYNKYFREAGLSNGARFALGALAQIGSAAGEGMMRYGATSGLSSALNGNEKGSKQGMNQVKAGYTMGVASAALFDAVQKRHNATVGTKDRVYILSKFDEGTGLAVWDKDGGKELKRIIFNNNNPQYIVDESEDMLYVLIDNSIKAYKL